MAKVVRLSSLVAFVEQTVIVDTDDGDAAVDKAVGHEGTLINERVYGLEADTYQAEVYDADGSKPRYEVIGVYTDTKTLQPFTYETGAFGPREALLRTLAWADCGDDKEYIEKFVVKHEGDNLRALAARDSIRPVSVRQLGLTGDPQEELHEIDEYN